MASITQKVRQIVLSFRKPAPIRKIIGPIRPKPARRIVTKIQRPEIPSGMIPRPRREPGRIVGPIPPSRIKGFSSGFIGLPPRLVSSGASLAIRRRRIAQLRREL